MRRKTWSAVVWEAHLAPRNCSHSNSRTGRSLPIGGHRLSGDSLGTGVRRNGGIKSGAEGSPHS